MKIYANSQLQETINICNQYAGTGVWLKGYYHIGTQAYNCYIKIKSLAIGDSEIEGWYLGRYDAEIINREYTLTEGRYQEILRSMRDFMYIPIDRVTFSDPLEIITDEEIHEILDNCERTEYPQPL